MLHIYRGRLATDSRGITRKRIGGRRAMSQGNFDPLKKKRLEKNV
jgi:hypothetical protein